MSCLVGGLRAREWETLDIRIPTSNSILHQCHQQPSLFQSKLVLKVDILQGVSYKSLDQSIPAPAETCRRLEPQERRTNLRREGQLEGRIKKEEDDYSERGSEVNGRYPSTSFLTVQFAEFRSYSPRVIGRQHVCLPALQTWHHQYAEPNSLKPFPERVTYISLNHSTAVPDETHRWLLVSE